MDAVSLLYGRQERDWQSRANCMGVDPDLFFPERGASTREAKEVCRGCVVREDCLEYALANGEKFGIWGGLSERERRRLRRARAMSRRAAASASSGAEPLKAGLHGPPEVQVEPSALPRRHRLDHVPGGETDELGPADHDPKGLGRHGPRPS